MDAGSFQLPGGVVSFLGPQGAVAVSDYQWVNRSTLEVSFAPQTKSGRYELVLASSLRDAWGQAIDLDGDGVGGEAGDDRYYASFTVSRPRVLAAATTDDLTGPVDSLRLTFSTAMDQTSFAPADVLGFTGPAGPISVTGHRWLGPRTLEVGFPAQTAAGSYGLTLGTQVLDTGANPLDEQSAASFAIRGPRVIAHTPASPTGGPVSAVRLMFDQPMNPTSFSIADDIVSFVGPGGSIAATGFSWVDAQTLEVRFAARSAAGQYQLVIGPQVWDAEGNALDQDRDGVPGESPADRYTAAFCISPQVSGTITQNDGLVGLGHRPRRGHCGLRHNAYRAAGNDRQIRFVGGRVHPRQPDDPGPDSSARHGLAAGRLHFAVRRCRRRRHRRRRGATAPRAGDWGFLQLASASASSSLDYAEIRYAGGGGFPEAALNIDNCSPRVSHLTVRHSGGRGVQMMNAAAPEISHLTVAGAAGTAVDVWPTSAGRLSNVVVSGVSGTANTTPAYGVKLWGATLIDGRTNPRRPGLRDGDCRRLLAQGDPPADRCRHLPSRGRRRTGLRET